VGVEACARCACLLSNEMQKERERKEVFRLGKYDIIDKKERLRKREKNFIFAREKKRRAAFLDLRWSESLTPRREPLRSLEGGFPSLSTTAVKSSCEEKFQKEKSTAELGTHTHSTSAREKERERERERKKEKNEAERIPAREIHLHFAPHEQSTADAPPPLSVPFALFGRVV